MRERKTEGTIREREGGSERGWREIEGEGARETDRQADRPQTERGGRYGRRRERHRDEKKEGWGDKGEEENEGGRKLCSSTHTDRNSMF